MRTSTGRRALAVSATAALLALTATPALADDRGSTTATINIAVRSVTVTPSAVTYGNCVDSNILSTGNGLTFPNGACGAPTEALDGVTAIVVTNGDVPSHIDVEGADAVPADQGPHWILVGGSGVPSQDEFAELTLNAGLTGAGGEVYLSTTPQCDYPLYQGSCFAQAGEPGADVLNMKGPSASTDPSTSFTTTVTWLAVP